MVTHHKGERRHHIRQDKWEAWLAFDPECPRRSTTGKGLEALETFNEYRYAPGARAVGYVAHDSDIFTYVRDGSLAYDDSSGRASIIHAGEFQRVAAKRGNRHRATNPSRIHSTQAFQMWLRPSSAITFEPTQEHRHFSTAQRRGLLCPIASRDPGGNVLHIQQDAVMYSAILEAGQHVIHELTQGRSAWVHLVQGEATLGDIVLTTGDGAGVEGERAISLTPRVNSEILLLDFGEFPPRAHTTGGVP